jgi:asparagine synthase (glutamine-hydrolysing)
MCGITGKISFASNNATTDVKRMQQALDRRGPDGAGAYSDKQVNLAMRRLAIIDLTGGDQPLYNEDQSLVIVGNGEIYNYVELQRFLKRKKHTLRTGSDIETAVHLYEEYGLDFVSHMRGIFALAMYDKKRNKVILARDRFGEKPLYYAKVKDGIIFSSELKSLLHSNKVKKDVDPTAVNQFFHFNFVPEPSTILKNVFKLAAGHIMEIDGNTMSTTIHNYWNVDAIPWQETPRLAEGIRSTFEHACKITNRADVPTGLALSGGIDSSAILATLGPHHQHDLTAFSVGYEHQPPSDERAQAKEFAEQFNIPFFTSEIKDSEVIANFTQNVYNMDDPIAELGAHNLNEIYKLTHKHGVKVLLSGVGGDELFWGYPWFTDVVNMNMDALQRQGKLDQLIFEDARPKYKKARQFTRHFFTTEFNDSANQSVLTNHLDTEGLRTKKDIVRRLQYLLQSRWLTSHVNVTNDRLSMANSVELRTPFLDYKLAELAYGSPTIQKGYTQPNKYWFKKALADRLPDYVTKRKKRGFSPPAKRWLFHILKNHVGLLNSGYLVENKILSQSKTSFLSKGWWTLPTYWDEMYKMITLEVWCREYIWGQTPSEIK